MVAEQHTERRTYDRRAAPSEALLVEFLMAELQRARERISDLEAFIASHEWIDEPQST